MALAALQLQAADTTDKVFITYSVLPAFTPNASDTVQLKACYSNYSQVDRPWRATNNIISVRQALLHHVELETNSDKRERVQLKPCLCHQCGEWCHAV